MQSPPSDFLSVEIEQRSNTQSSPTSFTSMNFPKKTIVRKSTLNTETKHNPEIDSLNKIVKGLNQQIVKLKEKIKFINGECSEWKNKALHFEYQTNFFKVKVEEELRENQSLKHERFNINKSLKSFTERLSINPDKVNESVQSFTGFVKNLQANINQSTDFSVLEDSNKLTDFLQRKINTTLQQYNLISKRLECVESSNEKLKKQLLLTKNAGIDERKQLKDLLSFKKQQMQRKEQDQSVIVRLKQQREFVGSLLEGSQKEKLDLMNQIYQYGQKEISLSSLQMLNKSQITSICLKMLAKIRQIESDRQFLNEKLKNSNNQMSQSYEILKQKIKNTEKFSREKKNEKKVKIPSPSKK